MHRPKRFSDRQDKPQKDAQKNAGACAQFNALFDSTALQAARSREADMQARAAAIAEVRLQVERYAFQAEELGLHVSSED